MIIWTEVQQLSDPEGQQNGNCLKSELIMSRRTQRQDDGTTEETMACDQRAGRYRSSRELRARADHAPRNARFTLGRHAGAFEAALLHDDLGAAAGQAEGPRGTSGIAGQAASLLPDRTAQVAPVSAHAAAAHAPASARAREAVFWDGRLAKADLAALARVQAVACGRARSAERRVLKVIQGAGAVVPDVGAEEDIPTIQCGEGAASKAVAAVRRERPATLLAELGLHGGAVVLNTHEIGVVGAAVFGLERIAASIPFALAGSRSIAPIEVAVGTALIAGFTRGACQQNRPFGVVAGPKAFRVFVVDEAVAVVVYAVATKGCVAIWAKDWETTAGGARGPPSTSRSADAR